MRIETAATPEAFATARGLIQEYADWLGVDLCFQNYDEELANLESVYGPPAGRLYLAMNGGEAAGCIGLRALDAPGEGEIKRLYVRPAGRGMGLGKLLVEHAIGAARQIGYGVLRFDTWPSRMPEAQAMYRRLGCVETPPYYHNPVPGIVFMRLDLDGGF
jgi:GNAT superfamily N-acetyltransferase